MMDRRRFVGSMAGGLLAVPRATRAQHPAKIPRIGYVSGTGSASDQGPYVEALRQGLRDLGQVEGRNFSIAYRGAEGKLNRVLSIVDELVRLKVDVIVAPFPAAIHAAKQATRTIPIVIVTGLDPVANGIVDSLARPGGNITGVATLAQNLNAKRLEILKEAVPRLSRVAVLWTPNDPAGTISFKEYEAAARALKIQIQSLEVRLEDPDVDEAFQTAANVRADALLTITTAALFLRQGRIAELAVKNRLPTMFPGSAWVESGGLMSYSTNDLEAFRLAATYVDKILKGAKPADLPVEQLAKFEFAINLKTAKEIGVAIPQSLLLRADKVVQQ
jgi:putative ABC transport system substrate-binding protein